MREWIENWGLIALTIIIALLAVYYQAVWHTFTIIGNVLDKRDDTWLVDLVFLLIAAICTLPLVRQQILSRVSGYVQYAVVFGLLAFFKMIFGPFPTTFITLITSCYLVGIGVYLSLCELLIHGLAKGLTLRRGEIWTKEMDYYYLFLVAVGIIGSMNSIQRTTGFSFVDRLGPLLVTISIAIRCVKTRAEVAGWNTRKFHGLPPA